MKHNILLIIFLSLLLLSACEEKAENPNALFSIEIEGNKKGYPNTETLKATIKSKKGNTIESVNYKMGEVSKDVTGNRVASFPLKDQKIGEKKLSAIVKSDGKTYSINKILSVLSSVKPKLYNYKILETYPHDMTAYTQGLEFSNDTLYESTGQYKNSSIRKTNYKTGEVYTNIPLDNQYFGEGLTILNNKVYQLTWREGQGLIYNQKDLSQTGTFKYNQSTEGWGLANNGKTIFKSDGTQKIWTLDSKTLAEKGFIEIYTNTSKIDSVNELEWVDGFIFANIYKKNAIAIVDPKNGAVHGVINMKGLKEKVTQHNKLDVLNGIAYKGEKNILYVTGKNWDKLFKIEIFQK
ncbi:glutaminyl-peptide cyclotransferase [Patiriisocius sp. Uisw_017]|jgi:glutamine cyclotransferase|uniref:glutaminyl-peptide cyclotransferase n=1 Tax=Patiriisocius sp. Uisw_017 TaxID=3230968 RepID=UPI0039ED5219